MHYQSFTKTWYCTRTFHKYTLKSTNNFFPKIKKKLNITYFQNYLKKKNIQMLFWSHCMHWWYNFHTVVGVDENDLGTSMLQATAILENCCFGTFSYVEYIFQLGNCWSWFLLAKNCVFFQENSDKLNTGLSLEKSYGFF